MAIVSDQSIASITYAVEELRSAGRTPSPRHVCWVTDEMVGLFRNGGGGTVVSGFCEALLAAGHKVSVLYTAGLDQASAENAQVIAGWRARGVNMTFLQDIWSLSNTLVARSHAVHRFLKELAFDIIHFHDFNGSGFAAATAKRMGLAYANTLICVSNFGTSRWAWECMEHYLQTRSELERDWIERRSIENADVVLCQSQHMARWLIRNGYSLPEKTYVQPSIIPFTATQDGPAGRTSVPIQEIVFFGRQEVRKGFRVFVSAAEKLARTHPGLRITFSGKFSEVDYEHSGTFALSRLSGVTNDLTFLAHLTRDQALSHVKGANILAVMPSIDDNFPGTVVEAVREGIEFIASNRGGIPEIVHPLDQHDRLFEPTESDLVTAVERVLAKRPPRPRLAFDPTANVTAWMDWHSLVPTEGETERPLPNPLVSVCVVHFDRPRLLAMVIEALKAQTYRNFEVILVDDGSTKADALAYIDELASSTLPFQLRLCRTPDLWLGGARNAGAEIASGEYLVFVDDDNVPRPKMIEMLLRAAQRRGLDAATCLAYILTGSGEPNEDGIRETGYFPAGGPISQGLIDNVFGDANAMMRRDTFLELGGFDTSRGVGAEDWHLFARLMLSGGRLEVVPEPLYWYRQHAAQLTTRPHSTHVYYERILEAYWREMANKPIPALKDALRLYLGQSVNDKHKQAAWWNLGARPHGDFQRQLLPHVDNAQESYRLLSILCREMGRFRDAARLILQGDNPHAHLLRLGAEIDHIYATGNAELVQGYYGEKHLGRRPINILTSIVARVRRATPHVAGFEFESVRYESDRNRVLVHPMLGCISMAVLERGFPARAVTLAATVTVDHESGPDIIFTLMLVDNRMGSDFMSEYFPERHLAKASLRIGPRDGSLPLLLTLDEPRSEALTIVLATEAIDRVEYGWAQFSDLRVTT